MRLQAGGALIGPHALGIVKDVEGVRHLAELGVVFLLFNIGLELSLDRLRSMQKFVFGLGSAQARAFACAEIGVWGLARRRALAWALVCAVLVQTWNTSMWSLSR